MSREVRFGLLTLGLSAGLALLGYFPTRHLAGRDAAGSMFAGLAVSLAASWAGMAPVTLTRSKAASFAAVNVVMAGMLVRLIVALAFALAGALSGKVDRAVFLIWVGLSYMTLLAVDTRYAVSSLAEHSRRQRS